MRVSGFLAAIGEFGDVAYSFVTGAEAGCVIELVTDHWHGERHCDWVE